MSDQANETVEPGQTGGEPEPSGTTGETSGEQELVRDALREVSDPELGVNIVDLGLVYDIEVEEERARITMTLTSPGCPAGDQILSGAQRQAESVEGIESAEINLVWKPFWTPDKMDPKVRAAMGY